MNINKHSIPPSVFAFVIGVLLVSNVIAYSYENRLVSNNNISDSMKPFTGTVSTYVDGKLVGTHTDALYQLAYLFIDCKTYNASDACALVDNYYEQPDAQSYACIYQNYISGGFEYTHFHSATYCSFAVGLSTDNVIPSGSGPTGGNTAPGCTNPVITNGLTPVNAVATHLQSNQIILTATFSATGTVNGIQKVCLGAWNDPAGKLVALSGATPYQIDNAMAIDSLGTTVNLVNGQSLTIVWQFNF